MKNKKKRNKKRKIAKINPYYSNVFELGEMREMGNVDVVYAYYYLTRCFNFSFEFFTFFLFFHYFRLFVAIRFSCSFILLPILVLLLLLHICITQYTTIFHCTKINFTT